MESARREIMRRGGAGPRDVGQTYLNGRGISLVPGPEVLRFHPAADHPKLKQRFPAMIARVIGSSETSFQVTYLGADGKGKAAVDKADQRRTLGASKVGVVSLAEDRGRRVPPGRRGRSRPF